MTPILPLLAAAALAAGAMLAPAPARADLMTDCAPEIGSLCADVAEGRGRITACLVANTEKLGGACRPVVGELASRTSNNRLVPRSVRNMLASQGAVQLPASCAGDAASLCPGVATGDTRIFACLYARESRMSATCQADVDTTMQRFN